jgi:predicted transcriptional regulator
MSARAAWRLTNLGFTQVFRYTAGKKDWMANGLPMEGKEAHAQSAGDLARRDVPTCSLEERLGDVKARIDRAGWDTCVVVFEDNIVLGLLGPGAFDANPQETAEQAMDPGVRTYRLDAKLEKPMQHMQKKGIDSVLVTYSDGKLFGLLKREDVEKALLG